MLPSPHKRGLGLRSSVFCRGHHWVHFRCGPVTRSPSRGWLRRSASSVSFPPRMRLKLRRFLTFPPTGLSPTEHVCLFWTHYSAETWSRRHLILANDTAECEHSCLQGHSGVSPASSH